MKYYFRNTCAKVIGLPDGRLVMPDDEVEVDAKIATLPAVRCYESLKMARIRTEETKASRSNVEAPASNDDDAAEEEIAPTASEKPKKRSTKKSAKSE